MDKRFIHKVRRHDRIAARLITVGGMVVIASVIAILVLIVKVTLPLFQSAAAHTLHRFPLPALAAEPLALGVDDYQESAYVLDGRGIFTFLHAKDGSLLTEVNCAPKPALRVKAATAHKNSDYTLLWQDQSLTLCRVNHRLLFDEAGRRTVQPEVETVKHIPGNYPAPAIQAAARASNDGHFVSVALLADNRLAVHQESTTTDLFGNETAATTNYLISEELPGRITAFTMDDQGKALYAGTDRGSLLHWELGDTSATRTDNVVAVSNQGAITALTMVFGDISVAVGDSSGGLTTWMPVRSDEATAAKKLRRIHALTGHAEPITTIMASRRSKSLLSLAQGGSTHLDHMTSENHLLALAGPLTLCGLASRENSAIGLDRDRMLTLWRLDNPHPEVSPKTLFGKVWYENYDEPQYVWQSSSGNDDFEPKFSLVPLFFGTIKGTLYAMLFAVPLAIFGAVYLSQFASPRFKKTVKPTVEIMASVPSVVIGFLIALWLAPLVEHTIVAVLLAIVLLPLFFVLGMAIVQPLYRNPRVRHGAKGYEFLLLLPVLLLTAAAAAALGPVVEKLLFAGDFKLWLFNDLGLRYDQRNSIIIAFGLGIAVIPIIFSITEDAISNIPASLTAASLALGASRWQTIWRVVLPSASPGISAAIMIGFGRAVGETMIVLMATGNTPIMEANIFEGMRTLAANVAVEMPESEVGGTHYRVLFLAALVLLMFTFVMNTLAELIRQRLRGKYASL